MYRSRKYRGRGTGSLNLGHAKSSQPESIGIGVPSTSRQAQASQSQVQVFREITNNVDEDEVPAKISRLRSDESSFAIPASQVPSQRRFLSQRSLLSRNPNQSTQINQRRAPTSFFEKILIDCGVNLDCEYYVLTVDHLEFTNNFRKKLKSYENICTEKLQQFLDGLLDLTLNDISLRKLLNGCDIQLPNSDVKRSEGSLLKDFLLIDFLQNDLINMIFDKIKIILMDVNVSDGIYVQLLLHHLKFVNHQKNGETLMKKLFEILEINNPTFQQSIIGCIGDLIDITRHNVVVKKLIELLPNDEDLLSVTTIELFNKMCLNIENKHIIKGRIISFMKNDAPKELWPKLISFLLKNEDLTTISEIIQELRHNLQWSKDSTVCNQEFDTHQKNVFNCIVRQITCSRKLYDIWLQNIKVLASYNQKGVDLIILIIMMSINDEKSRYIKNIIRCKIKAQQFNTKTLEELINNFSIILNDYINIFVELLDSFFKDRETLISNFAKSAYILIFKIEKCNKKLLISKLIGFICERHATNSISDRINPPVDIKHEALMVLNEINNKYSKQITRNLGLQLIKIFDYATDLTLSQYRIAMDIICAMAYNSLTDDMDSLNLYDNMALRDRIDMMVTKQVNSSILNIQYQGIIGIIRIIDHMAWDTNPKEVDLNCDDSINTLTLRDPVAKKAADYISLIFTSTINSVNGLALCYDELSLVINKKITDDKKYFNLYLSQWIFENIMSIFQKDFLNCGEPLENPELPLELKYGMNEYKSEEDLIYVNIAGCVLKPSPSAESSITVLSPMFNLLRLCIFQQEDSLHRIDAVLGSSICLPKCHDVDIFDDFNKEKSKEILDMYLYTLNWMREIVSAFATEKDDLPKVLNLLTELIKLEDKVRLLLNKVPYEYTPPQFQFLYMAKFKKPIVSDKSKKKPEPNANVPDTENTIAMETQQNLTIGNLTGRVNMVPKAKLLTDDGCRFAMPYGSKEVYRPMDINILLLLKTEFVIKLSLTEDKGKAIGLLELKFIIEDIVMKIESIFGIKKFTSDQQSQFIVNPKDLIEKIITYLPTLMDIFKRLTDYLKKIYVDGGSKYENSNLFTNTSNCIKICVSLCLRLFAALFTWPGFNDIANEVILKQSLVQFCDNFENDYDNNLTLHDLALKAVNNIILMESLIFDLKSAVHMFHLANNLCKFCDEDIDVYANIVDLCQTFLSRLWYTFDGSVECGAQFNILLDELLKGLFKDSNMTTNGHYFKWIKEEIKLLKGKDRRLKTFPCFTKANFPLLYRALGTAVIKSITNECIGKICPTSGTLCLWESGCLLINELLEIILNVDILRIKLLFLKNVQSFLKMFLKNALPILEASLKHYLQRVLAVFRSLQITTRFLHKLCCHSKKIKNTAIIAQVPFFRETVTKLNFAVKAAFASNNCTGNELKMGNLKNRDLMDGEIESDEAFLAYTVSSENEDEFMPEHGDEEDDDSLEDQTSLRGENSSVNSIEVAGSSSSQSRIF